MELIDKIYNQELNLEEGMPNLVISDLNKEMFSSILHRTYLFESDFRYLIVKEKIINIFKMLGLTFKDSILLDNMKCFNSRFNKNNIGKVSFNYWINFDMNNNCDKITYYHNGELFNGNDKGAFKAGISVENDKTSIYYSLGYSSINMFKYEIKLSDDITLCREFSTDNVFFIFESKDSRFIIKIDRKVPRNCDNYYILDNEDKLLKYLISLDNYNIDEIIKRLSEISLGDDLSEYSQITLCESKKIDNRWKDMNLLVLRKGNMYELIRTIDNKVISLNKMGEWKYMMDDGTTGLSIFSGEGVNYNISGGSQKVIDHYMNVLFSYDVGVARREVDDIKKLVLERYSVNRDR